MSSNTHPTGTGWIWKVFWILLAVTFVEVVLGIVKPAPLMVQIIGTSLLNLIFVGLTLFKAAYIVMYFMHLKFEEKSLQYTIYLPLLILVPYLIFILLVEGASTYGA